MGDVATNLRRAEALCLEAIGKGARLIGLPEFFTSQIVLDPRVHDAVLPADNDAVNMMRRLSRAHGCWIGGSMLAADGSNIYNRYYFAEPNGQLHSHDKDLPAMVEGAFYAPGKDDGIFDTDLGGVGAAVCWELIRKQTVQRLAGAWTHPYTTTNVDQYWLPRLPASLRFCWHQHNLAAKSYYRRKGRKLGLAAAERASKAQSEASTKVAGQTAPGPIGVGSDS